MKLKEVIYKDASSPLHSHGWAEGAAGQLCSALQPPPSHTFQGARQKPWPCSEKGCISILVRSLRCGLKKKIFLIEATCHWPIIDTESALTKGSRQQKIVKFCGLGLLMVINTSHKGFVHTHHWWSELLLVPQCWHLFLWMKRQAGFWSPQNFQKIYSQALYSNVGQLRNNLCCFDDNHAREHFALYRCTAAHAWVEPQQAQQKQHFTKPGVTCTFSLLAPGLPLSPAAWQSPGAQGFWTAEWFFLLDWKMLQLLLLTSVQ